MKTPSAEPTRPARWRWWLAALAALLVAGWALLTFGLDPWLRRRAEKLVAERTDGRYVLHLGKLSTSLFRGALDLTDVRLRPAGDFQPGPDNLPRLALDLPELHLRGLSLLDLLRRRPQHLTRLELTGLRLRVDSLPSGTGRGAPPHQRLPPRIPGIQLDELVLRDARLLYKGRHRPRLAFQRLDLTGRDLRFDAPGAADTTRLLYARRWVAHLRRGQGLFDHHRGWVRALDFDSRTGRVALDSFQMRPTRIGRRGPTYLTMGIGRARLTGWRLSSLHRRRFRADTLRVAGLSFDLTAPTTPPPPLHKLLAPVFRRLDLAAVRLADGEVRVRGVSYLPVIHKLELSARALRIDSAAFADRRRVLYAQAWELRTGPGDLAIDPPFYHLRYAALHAATDSGVFRATTLHLAPTMPVPAMARRKGHEVSHITLQLPEARVRGLDYGALLRKEGLRARVVTLWQPTIRIVGDGRFPINPRPSIVTPEAIAKLPFAVALDRIAVRNCRLDFAFTSPLSHETGTMRVTRLDGTIRHATTTPGAPPMVVRATAWLQDRCYVQATGRFDLGDPRGRHQITGTLGPAPFDILNPMMVPTSLMRFRTGQLEHATVEMTGDRAGIHGTMRARYRDMHVTLLSHDLERSLLNKLTSKVANVLVLQHSNPRDPDEPLQVGRIESRREPRFSVFALWKQGLLSGMLSSFGVGEKLAQKMSEKKTEPGEAAAPPPENDEKNGRKHRLRPVKKFLKKLVPGK